VTQPVRPPESTQRTTISVYLADADWLRALQREVMFHRDTYITLHDLLHEIISHADQAENKAEKEHDPGAETGAESSEWR
jgi:hypothetical protein